MTYLIRPLHLHWHHFRSLISIPPTTPSAAISRYLCYVHTTLSLSFGLLLDSGLFLGFDSGLAFFTSLSGFDFDFD